MTAIQKDYCILFIRHSTSPSIHLMPPPKIQRVRYTKSDSPKVIPVSEKDLPELEARRHSPETAIWIRCRACNASWIRVAVAMPNISDSGGQVWLEDEDFATVRNVAPFFKWEERNGVGYMCDAAVAVI
jgi:hypothetical protein